MKNKKSKINEGIGDSSSALKYIAFADAGSYVTRGNGMLSTIFPELGPAQVAKWFREIGRTESFKKNEGSFKSISSRFSSSPALKGLYITLKALKKKEVSDEEKESHESDIELVLNKISKIIGGKMTEEDSELFNSVSDELSEIAEEISSSLEGSLSVSEPSEEPEEEPEEPEEEPEEEEEEEEETPEETPQTSTPEPSAPTDTKKEQLERRVKNIVREILRKSVTKK